MAESRSRCVRLVEHFEIRMESREMPRDFRAEIFREPISRAMQFLFTVILSWNKQRRHLKPNVGLMSKIPERVEHGTELGETDAVVERFGKRFQIDIGCIHALVKFRPGLLRDVAGSNRNRFDAGRVASLGDVPSIFGENHRVVICKRDRAAPEPLCRPRDLLRRGRVREFVPLTCFRDVPILAKPAAKIASSCTERENTRAWQEVV